MSQRLRIAGLLSALWALWAQSALAAASRELGVELRVETIDQSDL